MNVKKVPFETVCLKIYEIEAKAKEVGAEPSGQWPDGRPCYTVPFLEIIAYSPKIVLSDSTKIAHYFDELIPEPPLFPKETTVLDSIATQYILDKVITKLVFVYVYTLHTGGALDQASSEYFVRTRALIKGGIPFGKMIPQTADGVTQAKKDMHAAFDALAALLDTAGEGNYRIAPFVTYTEIILLAQLLVYRAVCESEGGTGTRWGLGKVGVGERWTMAEAFEIP